MADNAASLSTLASTIKLGVKNSLKDLHTSMPGIVQSYDNAKQLATVQPAIKRVLITQDDDGKEFLQPTDLPILINVPVIFPRGGGFSLSFPVKKGDECLLIFNERAIDNWHKFGGVKEPNARRFHSISDAVCYVGLSSEPNKIPSASSTDAVLQKEDGSVKIVLKDSGDLEIEGGNVDLTATTKVTVTAPQAEVIGATTVTGTLQVTGAITASGGLTVSGGSFDATGASGTVQLPADVTADGVDIGKTHVHTGVTSGTSDSGPPKP